MTQAVVQLCGKQYLVSEGETFTVDRLPDDAGSEMVITDVLLVVSDKKVTVGTPLVPKAKVTLSVNAHTRGDKIKVFKYKSKSRYRKTHGHRQHQTTVTVTKIA